LPGINKADIYHLRLIKADIPENKHDKERHKQRKEERLPVAHEHLYCCFGEYPSGFHIFFIIALELFAQRVPGSSKEDILEICFLLEYRFAKAGRKQFFNQRMRRVERNNVPMVHDGDAVAENLSFVHVVRRDHDCLALLFDLRDEVPQVAACLRVEAGRRLI
jgi:hypothetical protein